MSSGYFFNAQYWHQGRDKVLDIFTLNPAITEYISAYYGDLFQGPRETVSLHLRLGYSGEPAKNLLGDRKLPPRRFYEHCFEVRPAPSCLDAFVPT